MIKPPWMKTMVTLIGTKETPGPANNPTIMGWAKKIGGWVASYFKADSTPWCGLAMGYCFRVNNLKVPTNLLGAKQWLTIGKKLKAPIFGCVVVFSRTGGGHVGIYVSEDEKYYHILGANQSDSVNVTRIDKTRAVGFMWADEVPIPPENKRVAKQFDGKVSTNEA